MPKWSLRSLLLVPVEDERKIEAALGSGADALVLSLGEEPTDGARASTRQAASDVLRTAHRHAHRPDLYVRLGDLDGPSFDGDLAAVMPGAPDGILLADARGGVDVQHLGAKLVAGEAEHGRAAGEVGIIAELGGCAGVFGLGSYAGASARLRGLAWHAEALATELGSDLILWDRGNVAPLDTVRHLTLFAARAAASAAIDTASAAPADDVFLAECRRARQHGFDAKLATTPAQVAIINAVFGPEEG